MQQSPQNSAETAQNTCVSLITSAYNAEKFLPACIQSVLAQTYSHFEWILIDDGSTDNTADIIRTLAATDPRVVPVFQANAGLAAARNVGLQHAKGTYFAFVDADDMLHPHMLACTVPVLQQTGADFVSFGFKDIAETDYLQTDIPTFTRSQSAQLSAENVRLVQQPWPHFLGKNPVDRNNWNKLYRRSTLGHIRYQPNIARAQDVVYGWRIRQQVGRFVSISNPLYLYRQTKGGVSRQGVSDNYISAMQQVATQLAHDYSTDIAAGTAVGRHMQRYIAAFVFKKLLKPIKKPKNAVYAEKLRASALALEHAGVFKRHALPIYKQIQSFFLFKTHKKQKGALHENV